jgi:hypothetical protein
MSKSSHRSAEKSHVEKAYEFFLLAERDGRAVSLVDIQRAAGYTEGTSKIYISKKWWWFLVDQPDGRYIVSGLGAYPFEDFADLHRQKRSPGAGSGQMLYLSSHWAVWLKAQSRSENRSVAEIVIDALDRYRMVSSGSVEGV